MSRIGNQPIPLPSGVKATFDNGRVQISGPLGRLEQAIDPRLRVAMGEGGKQIRIERAADERQTRALHGLVRSLVANMVVGVTEGYGRAIQVVGVGYSAKVQGNTLVLQIGYINTVEVPIPEGIKLDPPQTGSLFISGVGSVPCVTLRMRSMDKQLVGEFAARLRRLKPVEPYKGKGIRYEGEEVRRKAGKAFAAQE
jgi:large subunit ribosomal protein L6